MVCENSRVLRKQGESLAQRVWAKEYARHAARQSVGVHFSLAHIDLEIQVAANSSNVTRIDARPLDGRRQRGERTRLAIIQAALSLQEDGVLVPTAQQISDRAGVLIRSFFRHFEDMESLFEAVDDHLRDAYEALFVGGDRNGDLETRIKHAVARRSGAFEQLKNLMVGTKAQLWRYEVLRNNYARSQRGLRRDLEQWLPEMLELPDALQESLDAIASFEMWQRLRSEQDLSEEHSRAVVESLLSQLLIRS